LFLGFPLPSAAGTLSSGRVNSVRAISNFKEIMRIRKFFNNACEQIVYWSFKRILLGYAKVFAAGLFHLESRQNKFESEVKRVADQLVQASLRLDARVRALESKESQ
jgi:hypothetical protein